MAKTKLTTIEISRKRWLRGTGNGTLRNSHGKQCCLGFVCRVAGAKAKEILGWDYPHQVFRSGLPEMIAPLIHPADTPGYSNGATHLAHALSNNNDDADMPDSVRERELKKLARNAGYRFVFVD